MNQFLGHAHRCADCGRTDESGNQKQAINAGSVSTKGVELDLGAQASCNVNGTAQPFSPTFKANVSADYHHPLPLGPELELYANISGRLTAERCGRGSYFAMYEFPDLDPRDYRQASCFHVIKREMPLLS